MFAKCLKFGTSESSILWVAPDDWLVHFLLLEENPEKNIISVNL